MTGNGNVPTVRFRNGRQVLAREESGILVPREFKTFKLARKVIVSLGLQSWQIMKTKDGKFYASMRMERSVDPTPEQIEERKLEVWRDHLKQKLDIPEFDPIQGGHYLHQKYLEIAHDKTYHDVFNDLRTGHDLDTIFRCDCPYWEHDRRNPEC